DPAARGGVHPRSLSCRSHRWMPACLARPGESRYSAVQYQQTVLMDIPPIPPQGRTAGLMQFVRRRIAAREWPPGARLPSLRGMALQHGVSKSTVVEAYDRLAAEGIIRARAGAGF